MMQAILRAGDEKNVKNFAVIVANAIITKIFSLLEYTNKNTL